ncbi:MAG: hypothetical protein BRD38_00880 [Bacteroidetes bacterium QH_9_67_14]|nr:MAG: hypothetical protein BRD38_00880 [Bacteroidetes bacterium QH_9_67_14]
MATVLTAFALMFSFISCDSGGDPPETTRFTKTIEARHAEADSIVTTAELSAGGSSFGSDGVGELTREEGTSQAVTASAPKFEDESVAVPFENGNTFTIEMTLESNAPTAVATARRDKAALDETITFTGEQSSDPNNDELTYSWTFPDGDARGESVQRSFANTGDKTAELIVSDGELTDDAEVTVTIAEPVTVEAVAFDTDEPLNSPLALEAAGETIAEGEAPLTTEVSVNVDELTVSAAEHEQDSEVYADTSETFELADSPVTVGQRRVPHCVNGLDNDGDGLTGVGKDENDNGLIDTNDPGCTSRWDDSEAHRIYRISGGGEAGRKTFVSSNEGNWAIKEYNFFDFPKHIRVAVGNILFRRNVKLSSAQSSESFATRFECGSEVNISAIAEDDPSVDGWYEPVLESITTDWFSQDTNCKVGYVHKAFVNDNPGDGDDDVVLAEDGHMRSIVISWVYEPDHPALSPAALSKQSAGHEQSAGHARFEADTNDDVDVTVRSSGYVTGQ